MANLEKRRVGRTDLHVTSLGLGTATMGGSRIPLTREESEKLVRCRVERRRALRRYRAVLWRRRGGARIGDALRDKPRDEWVLSTKVGRLLRPRNAGGGATDGRLAPLPFEVVYDYTYDGIMRSVEDSYQRLGLAKIDILFVHDIGVYQHGAEGNAPHMRVLRDSGYRALEELKRYGRDQRDRHRREREGGADRGARLRRLGRVPARRALYAAGTRAAGRSAADVRRARDVDRGGRAAELRHPGGARYVELRRRAADVVERVKRIEAVCDAHKVPLAAAALQFPLAHPAVARSSRVRAAAAEFEANLGLLEMKIPAALWAELRDRQLLHPEAPTPS